MIKSDVTVTETAKNLPQLNLRNNLNAGFSSEETKIEILTTEKSAEGLAVKNHFVRLKKRMRSHSSSIF